MLRLIWTFIRRVSLIEEGYQRKVRMGWLSVVGSHKVNGVAAIHSDLMGDINLC